MSKLKDEINLVVDFDSLLLIKESLEFVRSIMTCFKEEQRVKINKLIDMCDIYYNKLKEN